MRHCIVSTTDKGVQVHTVETAAASLFEAAYAGLHQWARLWWFSDESVIEVRAGEQRWCVQAQRVSLWYSERFRQGLRL